MTVLKEGLTEKSKFDATNSDTKPCGKNQRPTNQGYGGKKGGKKNK